METCKVCGMDKTYMFRKTHNIAVDDNNYQALKNLGKAGDSFNDVVTRLVKMLKESGPTQ
jgi:predicted CopG family antitoxin